MVLRWRHVPFFLLTALPVGAALEPLLLYTMATIHVTRTERAIVVGTCLAVIGCTILMWRRHRVALPAILVSYGVFTIGSLLRLRGVITSGNFMDWQCLIAPFGWALSTIPAAAAIVIWGESYASPASEHALTHG